MELINRVQLRDDMVVAFNEEELAALCRRLDVAYAQLSGNTQRDRAGVLIGKMERLGRLAQLVAEIVQARPHLRSRYHDFLAQERPLTPPAPDDEERLSWLDKIAGGAGAPIEEPPTMRWDTEVNQQEDDA